MTFEVATPYLLRAQRVERAMMGIPTRLDFRVGLGLIAFAGWASGRLAGVFLCQPHIAGIAPRPVIPATSEHDIQYNQWFPVFEAKVLAGDFTDLVQVATPSESSNS